MLNAEITKPWWTIRGTDPWVTITHKMSNGKKKGHLLGCQPCQSKQLNMH